MFLKYKYLTKYSAMITDDKITEIYFVIDEFFKEFDQLIKAHQLGNGLSKKRNRSFRLSDSEVMTIMLLFHYVGFKNLKHFYLHYVQNHLQ